MAEFSSNEIKTIMRSDTLIVFIFSKNTHEQLELGCFIGLFLICLDLTKDSSELGFISDFLF